MHVRNDVRAARAGGARRGSRLLLGLIGAATLMLLSAASALAGPVMDVTSVSRTVAAPGETLAYFVWISNLGDEPTNDTLRLEVTLPSVLTADSAIDFTGTGWDCTIVDPQHLDCTNPVGSNPRDIATRNGLVQITTTVDGAAPAGPVVTQLHLEGGGAPPVDTVDETLIGSTPPEFGIEAFDGQVTANPAGDPFTQAGGHPYAITTALFFNTVDNRIPRKGPLWPVEPTKDVLVDLPPGLVGDPTVTGELRCSLEQLSYAEGVVGKPQCPPGSQVGEARVFTADGGLLANPLAVYNMVAPPNVPARFAFNVAGTVVTLDGALRSGSDYGLSVNVHYVSEGIAVAGTILTFWGTPADPRHNPSRACPGELSPGEGGPVCTTELPRRAFLRNPTSCTPDGVGLPTTARIDSWFEPGDFKASTFISHNPPAFPLPPSQWGAPQGTTGCELVPFEPSLTGAPVESKAGAPSAYEFDLVLPQSDDPDQIGTGDLKKAVVTLPVGLRLSPSSAAGLGACAPADIALRSAAAPRCPGAAKIGTLRIDTPLLDEPLDGSIYLAKPNDNPFDTLLSIYLVARGPGLVVKLAGKVEADPVSGQLRTTFDDNPQLPFERLHLEFKGGPRAPLTNPRACGTYTTHAVLTSWSGRTVASDSSFSISKDGLGTPCGASSFSPDLTAGGTNADAGKHTRFDVQLTRSDEDEELRSIAVEMPRGLLAKVAGVPLCPTAQAAAGTCGEGSRIGSVLTGSGAGPNPFYLGGRVYLTEAYNRGPFGLSIVVPAVAGPFDLGLVVVRASIRIDRRTAQLRVVSDPLPRILEGITLQIRDVRVSIDRERFMINPTSCLEKQVGATVSSTAGQVARLASRFQVGECGNLRLRPRMRLIVGARGRTRPGSNTPLTAKLTQGPNQANLRSVSVTLPLAINALLPVVNDACTIAEFEAGDCERARTGRAVAVTPLLDEPLRGNAYFVRRASGRGLPDLVVALRGQVDFDLVGKIVIPRSNRLSTRFNTIPDVPVTSFTLRMLTGENGAVGVARNLCSRRVRRARAGIEFRAQNGRAIDTSQRLTIRGCGRAG